MRLLLINYEFPPLGGGAGNATKNIARELVSLGHEVLVLTTWFKDLAEKETVDGYSIVRVKSARARVDRSSPLEMLSFVRHAAHAVPAIMKEFESQGVISFFALPSGLVAYHIKKRYGVPYIVSLRGGDVPGFLKKDLWKLHLLSAPLVPFIWKNAKAIVANSRGLQELAQKTASRFKKTVEYVPNGVDMSMFHPETSERKPNQFKILFVGRLTRQKGVTYIIDTCRTLLERKPELKGILKCEVIGDGPLFAELVDQAKESGLGDTVIFSGWGSRDYVPKAYQSSDVFVLPSFEEGMPNVVLEAISSGLPVIASKIGGNEELVVNGKNGFLFERHEEIPKFMLALIEDSELRKRFSNESVIMARMFDWKKVALGYEQLITL
jgi:glycosyltransferase involved in cell wall biosynthesis